MKKDQSQSSLDQAERHAREAEEKLAQTCSELQAVYASRSWRITAPLRQASLQLQLLRKHGFISRTKAFAKKIAYPFIKRLVQYINTKPKLRQYIVIISRKLGLYDFLRSYYLNRNDSDRRNQLSERVEHKEDNKCQSEVESLPPHARRIFDDLKVAIEEKNKGAADAYRH